MKPKFVSKSTLEHLYLKQNLSIAEICKELKFSRVLVYKFLKEYDLHKSRELESKCRSRRVKVYDDEYLRKQITRLYIKENRTSQEVKELLNISYGKLFKIVKSLGYKRPLNIKTENMKKTYQDRYGVSSVGELPFKSSGNSISLEEDRVYELLLLKFPKRDVIRQYRSLEYPFPCDFYIKSLDLYIEYNPGPRHNRRPFNPRLKEHREELELLKYKTLNESRWYEGVIRTWTQRDPLKRKTAKQNNLNWIEFFSFKEVKNWLLT